MKNLNAFLKYPDELAAAWVCISLEESYEIYEDTYNKEYIQEAYCAFTQEYENWCSSYNNKTNEP